MVKRHKTSWDGVVTRRLQQRHGSKGVYARYVDRSNKSKGFEKVQPTSKGNLIMTPSGRIKGIEQKYHNFYGNEKAAKRLSKLNQKMFNQYKKKLKRR